MNHYSSAQQKTAAIKSTSSMLTLQSCQQLRHRPLRAIVSISSTVSDVAL